MTDVYRAFKSSQFKNCLKACWAIVLDKPSRFIFEDGEELTAQEFLDRYDEWGLLDQVRNSQTHGMMQ
jgi:hypothetical protein